MSLGDWLHRVAIGGLLASALCPLGSDVVAQSVEQNASGQERPADQRQQPEREIDPVAAGAVQDQINRISRALEAQKEEADAKRKDEREERALDAQRQAALWAEYSGWAAWVSAIAAGAALIVTGAGVILVWFTLRHTRDAAVAAKDMVIEARATTRAAQDSVEEARKATKFAEVTADAAREALAITDRAWIRIEVELTDPLIFGPETISTSARVTFRNIGKAPATNLTTMANLHVDEAFAGKEARDRTSQRDFSGMLRHLGLGRALFPDEVHTEELALEVSTAEFKAAIVEANRRGEENDEPYTVTCERPCILAGVSYFLAGDRTQRFTFAPFEIRSTNTRHPGWDGSEGEFFPAELTVQLGFMGGFIK